MAEITREGLEALVASPDPRIIIVAFEAEIASKLEQMVASFAGFYAIVWSPLVNVIDFIKSRDPHGLVPINPWFVVFDPRNDNVTASVKVGATSLDVLIAVLATDPGGTP